MHLAMTRRSWHMFATAHVKFTRPFILATLISGPMSSTCANRITGAGVENRQSWARDGRLGRLLLARLPSCPASGQSTECLSHDLIAQAGAVSSAGSS